MSLEQIVAGVFIALPVIVWAYCFFKVKSDFKSKSGKIDVYFDNGEWKFQHRED